MAETTVKVTLLTDKFTGDDWYNWSYKFEYAMIEQDRWGHIRGLETKPTPTDPDNVTGPEQTAINAWTLKDSKAKACVIKHLDDSLLPLTRSCETSHQMWLALEQRYASTNIWSVIFLKEKYHALRADDFDTIDAYVQKKKEYRSRLVRAGVNISTDELAVDILTKLPNSWTWVMKCFNPTKLEEVTLKAVEDLLAYGEDLEKHKAETAQDKGGNSAFKAHGSGKHKSRDGNSRAGHSGGPGAVHCGGQGDRGGNKKRQPLRCYGCGEFGHVARECEKKGKGKAERKPKGGSNFFAQGVSLVSSGVPKKSQQSPFYLDSGANFHMINECNCLHDFQKFHVPRKIKVADGREISALGFGKLVWRNLDGSQVMTFHDVWYSPELGDNLISIKRITRNGGKVTFGYGEACIMDGKSVQGKAHDGECENDIFVLDGDPVSPKGGIANLAAKIVPEKQTSMLELWHRRLGHVNPATLKKMCREGLVSGLELRSDEKLEFCEGCIYGKQHRLPFPKTGAQRADEVLGIIHSDVCGPMNKASMGGRRYFVSFIDDYSRFAVVYFIKTKDEAFGKFKDYVALMETQTGKRVKILRSDNGGEYRSQAFDNYLRKKGIQRQLTIAYTPEQNAVTERFNRTVVESARSMYLLAGLGEEFWAEGVHNAVSVRNCCHTRAVDGKVPFEVMFGRKPSVLAFKTFGCDAYIHVPKQKRKKMDAKSWKGIFMGLADEQKGFRIFNPKTGLTDVYRDVIFDETSFGGRSRKLDHVAEVSRVKYEIADLDSEEYNPDAQNVGEIPEDVIGYEEPAVEHLPEEDPVVKEPGDTNVGAMDDGNVVDEPNDGAHELLRVEQEAGNGVGPIFRNPDIRIENILPGSRTRARRQEEQTRDEAPGGNGLLPGAGALIGRALRAIADPTIPQTIKQALESPEKDNWAGAVKSEYDSLIKNQTWNLVKLPPGRKAIGCRWVFSVKRDAEGKIDRYKARLVAQGFSQQPGIDFFETFSPVAKYTSIRAILAIATDQDLELDQMDVETAFLNGTLEEEIYMRQPDGMVKKGYEDFVCQLLKSLYGLKQSSRCWYLKADVSLKKLGFRACMDSDRCIYMKFVGADYVILALYVDDMLLASNSRALLDSVKNELKKCFKMKDLGVAKFILGMEICRDRKNQKMWLGQTHFIDTLLSRSGMADCKPKATPMEHGLSLEPNDGDPVDLQQYQSVVGGLTYLVCSTRPDLAASLSSVNQFAANPSKAHWAAIKRILQYLHGTRDLGITFVGSPDRKIRLSGYVDSDFGGNHDYKSRTGYLFMIGGSLVSWASVRQRCVSSSTSEAEYIAAHAACQEAIWLRYLLRDFGFEQAGATTLREDNQTCIKIAETPKFHGRTKHIPIKYHYVREVIENGDIKLSYIETAKNVADVLTKSLAKVKFKYFRDAMRISAVDVVTGK